MLTQETKDKIEDIVEKSRGYRISEWGEFNGESYSPTALKVKNGKIGTYFSINIHEDKGIYFFDYTGDSESGFVDLDKTHVGFDSADQIPKNIDADRGKKFKDIFDAIEFVPIKNKHPLLNTKNLKPFTSFYSKKIKKKKNCVVIPFYDSETDNLIGAQVRPDDLSKWTIPYSRTKNGYFMLQKGTPCPNTNIINVFVGESYTTMSEIAEAREKDTCICTAGISQVLKVVETLSNREEYSNANFIIVMDKEANGIDISKFEKDMIYVDWGSIQLDKHSNSTVGLTDFNEYQLRYGKEAVRKEINDQCSQVEVKMPEVIGYDNGEFKFVSPISRTVETVPELKILTRINALMNQPTLSIFKKREGIPEEPESEKAADVKQYNGYLRKRLINKFLKDFKKIQKTVPRELGIYEDEGEYIANLKGGRFKYNRKEDKVERVFDIVPFRKNIYVDNNSLPIECNYSDLDFTKKDLQNLVDKWKSLFNTKNKTPLYLLLGYCVQACYSGISPFRSHIWITGSAGSGKSTIKNNVIQQLTERLNQSATDVTVAAIDQELGGDGVMNAVVYAIDEAAFSGGMKKRDRLMNGVIQLARDLSYNSGKEAKKRGTQSGVKNNAYYRTASFMLSSVEHTLKDNQDIARFIRFNIEDMKLKMNCSGEEYKDFENFVNELKDKFMATLIKRAHLFNEYFDKIFPKVHKILGNESWLAHTRMAATACLSGLAILLHKNIEDTSEEVVETMKNIILKQKEDQLNVLNSRINVVDTILGTELNFNGVIYSCKEHLEGLDEDEKKSTWERYGLRFEKGDIHIRKNKFNVGTYLNVFSLGNLKVDVSEYDLSCLINVDKRVSVKTVGKEKVYIIKG